LHFYSLKIAECSLGLVMNFSLGDIAFGLAGAARGCLMRDV